ncbi:MAG: potassium transporter Kup [Pseudomonadota bacterium]|jgi:KUP system potassium uptake protein|uniref:potassium transporter Kup n=1 Tax=unclassified Sphingobium TaxID=2611147 RepID=UPI001E335865|nr:MULTISPECIES: potassium transporter Kup [unclassified Sphingobium]CAH0350512.1 Low affinity potassium transport system protein kup [Sphingobium sp. CECT 9361]
MTDTGAEPAASNGGSHDLDAHVGHGHESATVKLVVGAIGIVFGDIGTSPLYAFRETFAGHHKLTLDPDHILSVVSLMFWSMMLVVTLKYVSIIMRADNKGEGGSLALLALISGQTKTRRWSSGIVLLGVFATALFYGDSMITPAVSVLSAVEGLAVYNHALAPLILPCAVIILVGLFWIQSAGTNRVAALFGPIMLLYFVVISTLGVLSIWQTPGILVAFNPYWAVMFFVTDPLPAFLALGSVVLAVTGAEALYADMGHFGRNPIRISWLFFVLPALMLNYMGQGALLFREGHDALASPFYNLAPQWFQLPLIGIATLAAIIASQAVISGAFSVTQQAIQLGFMPRLRIAHTSASTAGQIYIPLVNWGLMVMVILLVLSFRTSSSLTSAYGIAVTGAMFIDNVLLTVLIFRLWKWNRIWAVMLLSVFYIVDGAYLAANLTKIPDGGWFPLLIGFIIFTLLTTWSRGRKLMIERMRESAMPIPVFIASAANSAVRVPGTAVFMTSTPDGVPHALLHNLKHNKVLHERVVLLTVKIVGVPVVAEESRAKLEDLGRGFFRLVLHYGFMQEPDVPLALKNVTQCGQAFKMMETSFFLARQTLLPSARPGMPIWREKIFAWMLRNAESAMEFFRLPTNRVVELGSQVEI